jgi:3-methyladenine DNA glycosylase AlkD
MPTSAKKAHAKNGVEPAIRLLKNRATKATLQGMPRYGLPTDKAFGIPVAGIKAVAGALGRDHDLALALWETGWFEARMLAAYVDDPARVTPAQMDRWCRDFDNWGLCDTVCFVLFDRTSHAWPKVAQWSRRRDEFVKRAAFALLASLALHDKQSPDAPFVKSLSLIERGAADDRNFVKKGVSWALRAVGRRSPTLNAQAVALARRLASSKEPAARWVGKDALRDLTKTRRG